MHIVVDLRNPEEAVGSFINSSGEVFTFPLELMDDPNPERGPRKGLTSEGGFHDVGVYLPAPLGTPTRAKVTIKDNDHR